MTKQSRSSELFEHSEEQKFKAHVVQESQCSPASEMNQIKPQKEEGTIKLSFAEATAVGLADKKKSSSIGNGAKHAMAVSTIPESPPGIDIVPKPGDTGDESLKPGPDLSTKENPLLDSTPTECSTSIQLKVSPKLASDAEGKYVPPWKRRAAGSSTFAKAAIFIFLP